MKIDIYYKDSGTKKDTSKDLEIAINALQSTLASNLAKNPHFDGVENVSMTLTLCGKNKLKSLLIKIITVQNPILRVLM